MEIKNINTLKLKSFNKIKINVKRENELIFDL